MPLGWELEPDNRCSLWLLPKVVYSSEQSLTASGKVLRELNSKFLFG